MYKSEVQHPVRLGEREIGMIVKAHIGNFFIAWNLLGLAIWMFLGFLSK